MAFTSGVARHPCACHMFHSADHIEDQLRNSHASLALLVVCPTSVYLYGAYALMALALVMWLVEYMSRPHVHLSHLLMRSSSALLIIGMIAGSIWAQQCWGDYWAWDPKENWAAVTWLFTLVYLHMGSHRTLPAFLVILLSFIALQITWYGVDYLPSAVHSLHTYK